MSETCETVTIETEAGPVIINKSDLKPEHKLIGSAKADPAKPELDKDAIKAELDELGIDYDGRQSAEKLNDLLIQSKEEGGE